MSNTCVYGLKLHINLLFRITKICYTIEIFKDKTLKTLDMWCAGKTPLFGVRKLRPVSPRVPTHKGSRKSGCLAYSNCHWQVELRVETNSVAEYTYSQNT